MLTNLLVHTDEFTKTWIDRMADAGVSVLGIHPPGNKKAIGAVAELLRMVETDDFRQLVDYAASRGLMVEYEFHAAGNLLPRELFDTHPEYFRVNEEGQRTPEWNFCVSNSEAMELVVNRAMEIIKSLYGSRPYYYIWMDDKRQSHCRCPRCCGMSSSDQQMLVINRIARALKAWKPEAKIAYLAYFDNVNPPTIPPEDNVFLEYAPYEKYIAKGPEREEKVRWERACLQKLLEVFGTKDAKILEYWYDNSLFSKRVKPPAKFTLDRAALERDMAYYQSLEVSCIASFACYLGSDYDELYDPVDISDFTALAK